MTAVSTAPSTTSPVTRARPPLAPGRPIVGLLPDLIRSPTTFLHALCEAHGDVVRFKLGPLEALVVRDPDDVEHILQRNRANWLKTGPAYETLKLILGEGLVTAEGDTWLKHRRLVQPAFHKERLDGFARTIEEEALVTAARLERAADSGEVIDVAQEMVLFTQRVVLRTILSVDVDDEKTSRALAAALGVGLQFVEHRTNSLVRLPLSVPLPSHRRFNAARAVLAREVQRIINAKRKARAEGKTGERGDLLDMLMDSVDEETHAVLDDKELFDEVMTLFLAGHETTSNLLSWTLALLAEHPDVEGDLVREMTVGPGGIAGAMRGALLGRVISESLRVRPPVWTVDRTAVHDDVLGGFRIAAGTLVFVSPWVVHRNPKLWPDAERFDPSRFLPENEEKRHRLAFMPFIAGQRKCIGDQFALMEARIALSTWLPRLSVKPLGMPEGESVVTFRPKGGLPARIARR
jgi:cytochrome P450